MDDPVAKLIILGLGCTHTAYFDSMGDALDTQRRFNEKVNKIDKSWSRDRYKNFDEEEKEDNIFHFESLGVRHSIDLRDCISCTIENLTQTWELNKKIKLRELQETKDFEGELEEAGLTETFEKYRAKNTQK